MTDVVSLLVTVAFFALAVGYVMLCDRLAERIVPPSMAPSELSETE